MNWRDRLAIGTAQFGMNYGLCNSTGKVSEAEAETIIRRASEYGCCTIDTAAVYGDAERVLGSILPEDAHWRIITKTNPLGGVSVDDMIEAQFRAGVISSLKSLNRESLYGLLIHNVGDLLAPGGQRLFDVMRELRRDGRIKKIGVSIYESSQIKEVLERFDIDLVQLPFNVLDQRLLIDGTLDRLKSNNIEIHARSVFFQGLLLQRDVPPYFNEIRPILNRWRERVDTGLMSPLAAALSFVLGLKQIDCAVLGVDSERQLNEILECEPSSLSFPTDDLTCNDPKFVNPTNWKL